MFFICITNKYRKIERMKNREKNSCVSCDYSYFRNAWQLSWQRVVHAVVHFPREISAVITEAFREQECVRIVTAILNGHKVR